MVFAQLCEFIFLNFYILIIIAENRYFLFSDTSFDVGKIEGCPSYFMHVPKRASHRYT